MDNQKDDQHTRKAQDRQSILDSIRKEIETKTHRTIEQLKQEYAGNDLRLFVKCLIFSKGTSGSIAALLNIPAADAKVYCKKLAAGTILFKLDLVKCPFTEKGKDYIITSNPKTYCDWLDQKDPGRRERPVPAFSSSHKRPL